MRSLVLPLGSLSIMGRAGTMCLLVSGDPFFTTKSSGTGLGLAISRSIVENLGGKLALDEANDQGTLFEIELPIAT